MALSWRLWNERRQSFVALTVFCTTAAICSRPVQSQGNNNAGFTKLDTLFYHRTCPSVHSTVASAVALHLQNDAASGAPLVRMFFHDCAVNGCEGSVLLNSTATNSAEKDAVPNLTLRGFDIIDGIKGELETACPGVVSCADIVALASQQVVEQQGGPSWIVELGRRDGTVSIAVQAGALLPSSQSNYQQLIDNFAALNLTPRDMATLSGAHTIGRAHCTQVARRFYGFNSSDGIDPSLSSVYGDQLRSLCPQPLDPSARVPLDPTTPNQFDNFYFKDLLQNQGLMSSDASLILDKQTVSYVAEYANNSSDFFQHFVAAMLKMGRVGVLTGSQGEVRRQCSLVNSS